MKIPHSIELKMFLSEIRNSDFELNSDSFITILDRGMKLAGITNTQLAKRVWTKEREVRRWRAGINIPLELRQINIIYTIEEMMEAHISRTEWWEKMNKNLGKWAKAIGVTSAAAIGVMLLGFLLTISASHPFVLICFIFATLTIGVRYTVFR